MLDPTEWFLSLHGRSSTWCTHWAERKSVWNKPFLPSKLMQACHKFSKVPMPQLTKDGQNLRFSSPTRAESDVLRCGWRCVPASR